MDTKFTPGPWQSKHEEDWDGACSIIANIDGPDDGRMHYDNVCEVYWDDPRIKSGEVRANIALIKAAPEMCDALAGMVGLIGLVLGRSDLPDQLRESLTEGSPAYNHRIEEARRVLAQARSPQTDDGVNNG